jgi:hypothetical protein
VVVIVVVLTIATTTIIMSVVFFIVISSVYLSCGLFFHDWRSVSTFLSWALAARAASITTPITASLATVAATARPNSKKDEETLIS